jgi:hypothetical protein
VASRLPLKEKPTAGGDWLKSSEAFIVPMPYAPAKIPVESTPSTT